VGVVVGGVVVVEGLVVVVVGLVVVEGVVCVVVLKDRIHDKTF